MTETAPQTGYAPVNGLQTYYEIHGAGEPLMPLHGGHGTIELRGPITAGHGGFRNPVGETNGITR